MSETKEMRKRVNPYRILIYFVGMILLAFGLTMNTKTNLGVSPIISIPFCIAQLFHLNVGDLIFLEYSMFVLLQFIIKGKNRKWYDFLQILVSIIFTRVMNLFSIMFIIPSDSYMVRFLVLAVAILCTGVGVAMSVNMKLIVNPGDGIVSAIADRIRKPLGLTKNLVDISCIIITICISLIFAEKVIGVGIGTIIAVLCVGRVITMFNCFLKKPLIVIAGVKGNENK